MNFSSELKNAEQAFADHSRIRVGGLPPLIALDKEEEITAKVAENHKCRRIMMGRAVLERQHLLLSFAFMSFSLNLC